MFDRSYIHKKRRKQKLETTYRLLPHQISSLLQQISNGNLMFFTLIVKIVKNLRNNVFVVFVILYSFDVYSFHVIF